MIDVLTHGMALSVGKSSKARLRTLAGTAHPQRSVLLLKRTVHEPSEALVRVIISQAGTQNAKRAEEQRWIS